NDGRNYFTMQVIRGRTFSDVIAEVHHASTDEQWNVAPSGWNLRRLIDVFRRVCEAMAHAHRRGVVHRDIKPHNIMVGDNGEAFVVDWGLAKVIEPSLSTAEDPILTLRNTTIEGGQHTTQVGVVAGTPAYMPPEQLAGRISQVGTRSDVYALGATLYEVLTGHVPHTFASLNDVVKGVEQITITPLGAWRERPLPRPLVEACMRSMRARPEDRYTDAGELAEVIATWLEGTQRRAQARRSIHASLEKQAHADGLRAKAEQLQTEAHTVLSQIGSWEQAHHKHAGWAAEDQAQSLEKEAVLAESESEQWLFNALSQAPNFTEVHNAIAQRYIEVHKRATTARDQVTAARAELYVRTHTEALPTQDSNRARYQRYLSGHGHLSLTTEPSEVNVALARFTAHHRRLVLDQPRVLGPTPLQATELEQGSYLLTLEAPGYDTVRYPVLIERQKHWNTTPPQATAPQSIQLPPKGVLDPETDCFIPAGWFQLGEQGAAYDTLPHGWQWLDSFVIKRHPVTNREYIAFLDDLVAQ
ncbi:MAG: protein kinase, partial [Myxococcota bacterium]